MHDWKPWHGSSEFLVEILDIKSDSFIEVGINDLVEIKENYNGDYDGILGKYDKVFVSQMLEGYGMSQKLKDFYQNFDKEKIFIINDGFICEKWIDQIYSNVPKENIFYDPTLSFWYVWNRVLSDCGHVDGIKSGKINNEFRKIHNNNIDKVFPEYNIDRDMKFIILNRNFKPGREECVRELSDSFLRNNWVSCDFIDNTDNLFLRRDDYSKYQNDNSGWNSCYEILWKDHSNKAYIQPYWESCAWTDAITDGHYMITEKSLIPFILGNISIPLGIFYVDFLEKMGYQFVKKIGDISVNETIDAEDWNGSFGWKGARTDDVKKWNYKLFDKLNKIEELCSLADIKYLYIDNLDIMEHNKQLVKKHMTDTIVIEKLKKWILE